MAYAGIGRYALAFRDGLRAIELDPGSASAHNNLAWILAAGPDPAIRDGAEAGDFERAVRAIQQAIELERQRGPSALLAVLRAHLANFEAGRPLRDPR